MPTKAQYRWVVKYPDSPSEKSSWMDKRQDVVSDFTQDIQNDELLLLPLPGTTIDPINAEANQDPVYYLDKRLFMDGDLNNAEFLYLYHEEEGVASIPMESEMSMANDPAWTLQKGPWVGDVYECIKEYSELFSGNCTEIIDGCFTRSYIYFRSMMPALPSQLQ